MSLRILADRIRFRLKARSSNDASAALIFVLNRSYLVGLKALAYSMLEHETLLDLPVIVLSEEHDLADDPFVMALSDQFVKITDADIAQFSSIPSGRIDPRVRLDWIPKYTHLKWMMFSDYGVDKIIWIDTDIICLRSLDHLLGLDTADLYAGSVFQQSLYLDGEKQKRPEAERDANIWAFSDRDHQTGDKLNTGVLVVNRPLLDDAFRHELIAIASEREYVNEQQVVSEAMRRRGVAAAGRLQPWDNYNQGYIKYCSPPVQKRLLEHVRLLHYVGANGKPWEREGDRDPTIRLWWDYYSRGRSLHPIFA